MGNLVKGNPVRTVRDGAIAALRLQGKTYREIADKVGCGHSTITKTLNDDEVKAVIEVGTRKLTSMIPVVIRNYHELLNSDDEKIKLQASRDISKVTGIQPSHTVNQFFTQINQHNDIHREITPVLQKMLADQLQPDDDIIDIEQD